MRRLRVVVAGLLERGSAIAFGDGVAETLLVDDALAPGLEAVERRGVEVRGAVSRDRGRRDSAETLDLVLALGLGNNVQRVGFVGGARQLATLGRALEDGLARRRTLDGLARVALDHGRAHRAPADVACEDLGEACRRRTVPAPLRALITKTAALAVRRAICNMGRRGLRGPGLAPAPGRRRRHGQLRRLVGIQGKVLDGPLGVGLACVEIKFQAPHDVVPVTAAARWRPQSLVDFHTGACRACRPCARTPSRRASRRSRHGW